MVSSIYPFTAPNADCCIPKYVRVFLVILPATNAINGVIITVTSVSTGFVINISIKVPTSVKMPENICKIVESNICPILSTSFVKRLIISPALFVS